MNRIITTSATVLFMTFSLLAFAQDDRTAQFEQRMEEARTRLDLSDEQVEAFSPVLKESITEQRRILSNYGVNLDDPSDTAGRLRLRQARAMRKELEAVRADTQSALKPILNDEQLDEFQRMQEERRAEMRERIRGGR